MQGDLASRNLVLESKRFYLDVKENNRGRFIKIAEISADGRKNQILMTFSTAALFNQNLLNFIDFYQDLAKLNPDQLHQVQYLQLLGSAAVPHPRISLKFKPICVQNFFFEKMGCLFNNSFRHPAVF